MEAGELFGSYRLIARIGSGGMGEVWKAEDVALRRTVAIKILPAASAQDRESNERFKREARTAAQLNHPNIATIHAIDQNEDRAFIVMEFVEGEPLSRVIRSGTMSEETVAFVAKCVADALAEAHDKGIVHRDIKPDNIVVSGPRVKVLDFGIAKRYGLDASGAKPAKGDTEFRTEAGIIIGTVQYMSPEQAMGRALDGRSDIFSLGVVMYEAIAGRLPFEGDSTALTLTRIIRDDPPNVRVTRPNVSPKLSAIVMRCLEKDPERRYPTARELAAALSAVGQLLPHPLAATGVHGDEDAIPTMITTPKPAPHATRKRPLRTEIERRPPPAKSSALPWVVTMIAVVVASVAGTAWYFTRAAKPVSADATAAVETPKLSPPGADIAVTSPVPALAETADATSTIVDLAPTVAAPPGGATSVTSEAPPTKASTPPIRSAPTLARDGATSAPDGPPANATKAELAEYYYRKGLDSVDRRQPVEAYESFRKVVALDPTNASGWVRSGELALFLRNPQEAMGDFKKAAQIGKGLDAHDALTAEFGRAIVDGDVAAMEDACRKAPFDRVYNELRRAATKRGADDCPAPIGMGLEGGRGPASTPRHAPGSGLPTKPIRRP